MTTTPPEEELALAYDPLDDTDSFEPKPLLAGVQEDFDDHAEEQS